MKPQTCIIILSLIVLIFGCASPDAVKPDADQTVSPEDEIFFKAEKLFHSGSYKKAFGEYEKYYTQDPNRPFAVSALMKMGAIKLNFGEYEAARSIYSKVPVKYPKSSYAAAARVEILVTYYKEGNFEKVIKLASTLLEQELPDVYVARISVILGDTYLAMDAPEDSIYFYTTAVNKSVDPEKREIVNKFKQTIELLDMPTIQSLLEHIKDDFPRGYLLYRLGLYYAEEERYNEALNVLSEFLNDNPEHENAREAEELVEELSKKTVYQRAKVGCLLPLSGRYKVYGELALKGIELALMQMNSKDVNSSIEIVVKDTAGDDQKAAEAVEEFVQDQVAAIIGPIVTAESAAVAAQKNNIPIITITQKDGITEIGDNVFRNFHTPEMQAKSIVSYAIEKLELKKFAILYPDEKYGTTFMNLFWDEVLNYGGKVVGLESYDPKETNFADPIKKLVGLYYDVPRDLKHKEKFRKKPSGSQTRSSLEDAQTVVMDFDAVFIPDEPDKAGLIIPLLAYYDVDDVYLLGTNLWHSQNLIKMAEDYVQGAILVDGFFAESKVKEVVDFVKVFEAAYGKKPGFIEATAYDTAKIIFNMISRPDIRTRNAIKKGLFDLKDFPGVTGQTSFDDTGNVWKKLYLLRIDGDKFIEIP